MNGSRMERETGIEPATSSLGSWRSTAELLPLTLPERSLARLGISPAGSTPAKRLNLGSWRSTAELLPLGHQRRLDYHSRALLSTRRGALALLQHELFPGFVFK